MDIRKSDWILGFNDRSLENPPPAAWTVKKDGGVFDQFTGATITPRAVVATVARTLAFARNRRDQLFEIIPPDEATGEGP